MARRILFITPNLPPIICGIYDHSVYLGRALSKAGCELSMLGSRGDPRLAHDAEAWQEHVSLVPLRSVALVRAIRQADSDWIWLQYSGYGYSRLGAPIRLYLALKWLSLRRGAPKLAVCLHESYCRPGQLGWKGRLLSFWQKRVVTLIARQAEVVFPTVEQRLRESIEEFGVPVERVVLLPIAANLPELSISAPERARVRASFGLAARDRVAIIFGKWDSQRRAFERFRQLLPEQFERGLDHLILVGGDGDERPAWTRELLAEAPWRQRTQVLGPLPAERISQLLAAVDIGLVSTDRVYWQKSGAARAYQQAGLRLWFSDAGQLSELDEMPKAPGWDEIAARALEHMP